MAVAALVAVAPPLLLDGNWSGWIYKGLAILLIGCPCALVISTPAAIAASLAAGARRGLLMKGGAVLEQIGKITKQDGTVVGEDGKMLPDGDILGMNWYVKGVDDKLPQ